MRDFGRGVRRVVVGTEDDDVGGGNVDGFDGGEEEEERSEGRCSILAVDDRGERQMSQVLESSFAA